jgi:hypothetical protein
MRTLFRKPNYYFGLSLLICVGYFVLFIFPNRLASENVQMVAIFEPDEFYPLRFVFNMIQPADSIRQAITNFVFYRYYFYGFPYFGTSALSLLPLSLLGKLGNTPMVMTILRQGITVLPMLATVLLLVNLQTQFKSYKSIVLLLLLLSVPAVVQNNFWWHPDSLAILFAVLVIVFLNKDDLRFGRNFYLAAFMSAFSAATKGIGFYFFLSVFAYIVYGYYKKAKPLKNLILASAAFLACMAAGYFLANPMLISEPARNSYFSIMQRQSVLLSSGYEVVYSKGFLTALPTLTEYYGSIPFLLTALLACVLGIVQDKKRLLNIIILTWLIPISVMVFGVIHFKYQYWLPVALPLFSCLVYFLPDEVSLKGVTTSLASAAIRPIAQAVILIVIAVQFVLFVKADTQRFGTQMNRMEENPSIQFYAPALDALKPLPSREVFVYHDVQMYVPGTKNWKTDSTLKLLNYDYILSNDFDVVMLMQQRIWDYTQSGTQGIEAEEFRLSQEFYRDANEEKLKGYHLVFRNDFGLVFVKDEIYQQYFAKNE